MHCKLGSERGGVRPLLNPSLHTLHLTSDFIYIKLQSKWDRNVTCIKTVAAINQSLFPQ